MNAGQQRSLFPLEAFNAVQKTPARPNFIEQDLKKLHSVRNPFICHQAES